MGLTGFWLSIKISPLFLHFFDMNKLIAVLLIIVLAGVAYLEFQENPSVEDVPTVEAEASVVDEPTIEVETPEVVEADLTYTLETDASVMTWEASRIASSFHKGTIALQSGELLVDSNEYVGGNFVIDMTKMTEDNGNERVLSHLQNEDFFHVEAYPTSTFEILSVTLIEAQRYEVTGNLTILGNTHPLTFEAEIEETDSGLHSTAEFVIDRTQWGITYGSGSFFDDLGDKVIKDEIGFTLDLTFQKN